MEENINNRWICVQCACHLENSFKFCPKCGLKLSQPLNKEMSARSVENDQLSLFAKPRKSTQRERLMPSNATVPQRVSPASSGTVVQTKLQLPWFFNLQDRKRKGAARI